MFPRWLSLPALTPRHYLPVGIGLLGGQLLTLAGLAGNLSLLRAGALFTLCGWAIGMFWLARLLVRAPLETRDRRPWHALSCLVALGFGLVGLVFHLLLTIRVDAQVAFVAIKFGGLPMLLPIYFTVCHRMIPFFTNMVVRGYTVIRPMWALGATWLLVLAHLWLELRHAYQWLWLADVPLAVLFVGLLICLVAARPGPRIAASVVPRLRVAADRLCAVRLAKRLVRDQRRIPAGPRAGPRPCSSGFSAVCWSPWSRA